ncbi:phosphotransferase family protein [Vibrio sp. YIC-376]|uniref:phosphotransferase family protein n=1 Tax=Vibrio sp. YIC-376 TaxID=3136162 RepID=UPI00402AD0E2
MSKQELSQMGSAKVILLERNGIQVIEKHQPTPVEATFYQNHAESFNQQGIYVPNLIELDMHRNTLQIEYIPNLVEQDFLRQDHRVIKQLVSLHEVTPTAKDLYHTHQWTLSATQQALTTLMLDRATEHFFYLTQENSGHLFDSANLISGDTNAGNWGLRKNGELVLFDWERFSKGHVAIDLAPLIKGMGTQDDYLEVAQKYVECARQGHPKELTGAIVEAKTWIVVEVVNILVSRNNPQTSKYLNWFRQTLPNWVKSLSA